MQQQFIFYTICIKDKFKTHMKKNLLVKHSDQAIFKRYNKCIIKFNTLIVAILSDFTDKQLY